MSDLVIKGTQKFLGKEIPIIEGGFGEGEKCILAKTIAEVHGVELKFINQLLNSNIDEFEIGIDILDIKNSVDSVNPVLTTEFNKQSISNSKNIYLLSEQGYMLLVSFMKTERAKEIRRVMRREYFKMRETIKNSLNFEDEDYLIYQLQEQKKIKEQLNQINNRALKNEKEIDNLPLLTIDSKEVSNCVKRKAVELLGGKKSGAYEKMSKKVFSDMYRDLWRQFGVTCIAAIKRKDLSVVKNLISEYKLPYFLEKKISELNNQVGMII
jgi:hypothetical protein